MGTPLQLSDKAIELMAYLTLHRERQGDGLTQDQIVQALWPAETPSRASGFLTDLIDEINDAVTVATGYSYPTVFAPGQSPPPRDAPTPPRLLVRLLQPSPSVEIVDDDAGWWPLPS